MPVPVPVPVPAVGTPTDGDSLHAPTRPKTSEAAPVHTVVFLLRSLLGLGGGLMFLWELTRQASGPGWRKPHLAYALTAITLATFLAI
ncbi:hypothetical protein ACGFNQ_21390 [Streptomyces asoensis]|uniref:hypothetical protein n=1 Tax=Streptomyces asoensis TaxID=249586 RepID=UPI0037134625